MLLEKQGEPRPVPATSQVGREHPLPRGSQRQLLWTWEPAQVWLWGWGPRAVSPLGGSEEQVRAKGRDGGRR